MEKFKKFYRKNYKEHKTATIILTILIAPIIIALLVTGATFVIIAILSVVMIWLTFWAIFRGLFGKREKSSPSVAKKVASSARSEGYSGYSKEDVVDMIYAEPKLSGLGDHYWKELARALVRSKYVKEVEVMKIGHMPVYIFPYDKKPYADGSLFGNGSVRSGGSLLKKGTEHLSLTDFKSGYACVVWNGKRLLLKDM